MITEQELSKAREIVEDVVKSVGGDRDRAMATVIDMCSKDPELQALFAKVGWEMYTSAISVKH